MPTLAATAVRTITRSAEPRCRSHVRHTSHSAGATLGQSTAATYRVTASATGFSRQQSPSALASSVSPESCPCLSMCIRRSRFSRLTRPARSYDALKPKTPSIPLDETRRSIRFVLPGLASFLIAIISCWACPSLPRNQLERAFELASDNPISSAIAAIFGAGGFGYLGAQLYFYVHWTKKPRVFGPIDHRKAAKHIRKYNLGIDWSDRDGRDLGDLSEAWIIFTWYWFSTRGGRNKSGQGIIDSMTERTTSLMDHAHSAGILFFCTLLMTTTWAGLAIAYSSPPWEHPGRALLGLAVPAGVLWVTYQNHKQSSRMFEVLARATVQSTLLDRRSKNDQESPGITSPLTT